MTCVSPIDTFRCPLKPFGDLIAEDYLEFAKRDLSRDRPQSAVNSFSNSKRCFHYQIDRVLYALGLREATKRKSFPQKVDILEKLEIIPGALLRTFNKERNLMEHEYLSPTKGQVENSIALCELLLMATREVLTSLPILLRVKLSNDKRDLLYKLVPDEYRISVREIKGTKLRRDKYGEYYSGPIFKMTSIGTERELKEGITLEDAPEFEINLFSAKESEWMKTARLFTLPLGNRAGQKYLPNKGQVWISTAIELSIWKKLAAAFFNEK